MISLISVNSKVDIFPYKLIVLWSKVGWECSRVLLPLHSVPEYKIITQQLCQYLYTQEPKKCRYNTLYPQYCKLYHRKSEMFVCRKQVYSCQPLFKWEKNIMKIYWFRWHFFVSTLICFLGLSVLLHVIMHKIIIVYVCIYIHTR